MALKEQLRALRMQSGLSQEQLAERMGLSRQAVAKWESGAAVPELEKLVALADYYQLTLDVLVRGETPCAPRRAQAHAEPARELQAQLIDFLLLASASTYAGKGAELAVPSRPGAHDLSFAQGDYRYVDTYLGGQRFVGEEALFVRDECVWGMNYSGRTLAEGFSGDFHKAALLLRPREYPFRGPLLYRDGRFTYHNTVEGSFTWFVGQEEVYCDDQRVFECLYHGGLVMA